MKNLKVIIALGCAMTIGSTFAQDIVLPEADKKGGAPIGEAFANRHSTREFDSSCQISEQTLSNLLWAAAGVNRPNGYRTNPTAMNRQEIDLYVFTKDAVFMYEPVENALREVTKGDHRNLVAAQQAFVNSAPVSVVIVANIDKLGNKNERNMLMAAADAGIVSQNINLFCSANGLATVPRASMDVDGIKKLLKLSDNQIPMLNNPVGYPAK